MSEATVPVRSYAEANLELGKAFDRYLEARGNSPETRRKYMEAVDRLVESIGSASVVELERSTIRMLFTEWESKGLHPNSSRLYVCGLRSFFKFVCLTGITRHNPMLLMGNRKIPTRIPLLLSVGQVTQLIDAAQDPFERAVVEVLYATGVRVSELVALRLENVDFAEHAILVKDGKGSKDRYVLFGSYAELAIRQYQQWRPSKHGYLFEAPERVGQIYLDGHTWHARFYVRKVQREISVGPADQIPTKQDAREIFNRLVQKIPGFRPVGARPYSTVAIRNALNRLAQRVGIPHIHPHALRRAAASHMLQHGASLRVVQDLLGHERLNTTMRYTLLDTEHLRAVYDKTHPHSQGGTNDDDKKD
jgi:integrase/recombinase XerC